MPTLEVKPNISLSYLDSGVPNPPNDTYLTLFMLHGGMFYSPVFNRAIAVSSKYDIRFVAITRRDYPGSTLLNEEDIKAVLDGPTDKRLRAFADRAEEIQLFIKHFVETNNVPPIKSNGGGFSLAGWSIGNMLGLSVLGFGHQHPDLAERLTPYFRSCILFDATALFPPPLNAYHPLTDESMSKEERGHHFSRWISSYFVHSADAFISGDVALLNQRTPSPEKPPSISQFTSEEYATTVDKRPMLRADIFFFKLDQRVNESILEYAFTQRDSETPAWPNVPARSLYGDQTSWTTIFTQRKIERWLQQLRERNSHQWIREYEPICVPGGNHFLHWDEPDKFMETVKQLML